MDKLSIHSKLPQVGVTIFTVMSALAQEKSAVNLGQGFPDFDCDPKLVDAVVEAMRAGLNQYPSMLGVLELRQVVTEKIRRLYQREYDAHTEVTITAGATQAIINAVLAVVQEGDEVIVLEPCYDSYIPNVLLAGGRVVRVPLQVGSFRPDLNKIASAISPKTKLIIINTPHNPSATVWSKEELNQLAEIVKPSNAWVLSDEVYEHMVYEPHQHISVSSIPELAQRAFVVSSFGKTLHVTGWKVGYCVAPADLTKEYRKVHQFNVFTVNTPVQYGIAKYLQHHDDYSQLATFYRHKRDRFREGLGQSHFRLLPCQGSYFQCVRLEDLKIPEKNLKEAEFCLWLTEEIGVAAIPLSAFYLDAFDQGIIRFCFAKQDATLDLALSRLVKL
ncbi:MAG: pyridoxal phosphate-dependent aminotransferase [Gammaproteobacteria bacterium]|nr:pyridoxal phosphate-dependent aminotransferase [Gammaproteobacteria bacterium]